MKAYRVHIRGWTASFRYPVFIAGFQPTLSVPPLSTIYGLISAAKGNLVTPADAAVGYVFSSSGKAVDLETIYELAEPLKAKSNVCRRVLLFEPSLHLYFDNHAIAKAFDKPHYPLLIGRSTELAMVEEIKEIELEQRTGVPLGGTIIPFPLDGIFGPLQALPTHFTDEIPRRAEGTRPYYMVESFIGYDKQPMPYDGEKGWGVWFHK
ncbi:MAG: type I-B CRISPR-associated protein Cas5 [Nitrospirae bacterium]|nr:type I-B CRISPR-associated protein Cas5 [Nitrospirota bacterium]